MAAKLTPQEIDRLIDWRNRITARYSYRQDELDRIDHKLAQVPAGTDNRVDLALGRPCATLPARPDYGLRADTVTLIEATRIIFEQAEPIEYQ